jgi:uncharacterized membrane protein
MNFISFVIVFWSESNLIFTVVSFYMLEVVLLVLLVVVLFVIVFGYSSYQNDARIRRAQAEVISARDRLEIAERKFMQGKIKRAVFDSLVNDLEGELVSAELVLFRNNKSSEPSIVSTPKELLDKLSSQSKYKKAQAQHILKEIDLINSELGLLESKFLKRELKQSVFEELVKKKESLLIKKENELMKIIESKKN